MSRLKITPNHAHYPSRKSWSLDPWPKWLTRLKSKKKCKGKAGKIFFLQQSTCRLHTFHSHKRIKYELYFSTCTMVRQKKKDHKGLRFRSYKSTNINTRQINSTQSIKFKTDKLNKAKIIKKTKTKHKSLKKLISVLQK